MLPWTVAFCSATTWAQSRTGLATGFTSSENPPRVSIHLVCLLCSNVSFVPSSSTLFCRGMEHLPRISLAYIESPACPVIDRSRCVIVSGLSIRRQVSGFSYVLNSMCATRVLPTTPIVCPSLRLTTGPSQD